MSTRQGDALYAVLEDKRDIDRVSELVRRRLVECGWRDQVHLACRKVFEENDNVTSLDELIAAATPSARAMVPDSVKRELLHELDLILNNIEHTYKK